MSLINVSHLVFYYDGSYDNIFDDISFQIDTDWRIGLTGRNGRGKTTFLKLLLGEYEYSGSITADVQFDYFPYEVREKERNTIDIVEEADENYELWMVLREMSLLGVDAEILYRPFSTLSHGEQTKVLLAVLFSRENHFLLIDEPTNHLDMEARMMVMEYLSRKKGFILVSHDRSFLDGCVNYILAINKTGMEVMKGNFTTWWDEKGKRDIWELTENEKLKKDIKRLEQAAGRTERWSDAAEKTKRGTRNSGLRPDRGFIGHKAAKMMKHSVVLEQRAQDALAEKKKLLKNIEQADELKMYPLSHHKNSFAALEDISISYGKAPVLEHLDLTVNQGEIVALCGRNGCGKTSLLKLILQEAEEERSAGEGIPYTGIVEVASGLVISYVSQDTSWLKGGLREFAAKYGLPEKLFMGLLRKLDFSRVQFDQQMEEYSGGQKKKVLIAKSVCEQAHLYIWDEPLNYIDIFSRMQIAELIRNCCPTMLMVEHDRNFVDEVSARTVFLS